MGSACILACDIEKGCSQYDGNLFAGHVCSSPCSRPLWSTYHTPRMRWSASISTIDFHRHMHRHSHRHRQLMQGGGAVGSVLVATPGSVHRTVLELQLLSIPQHHIHTPPRPLSKHAPPRPPPRAPGPPAPPAPGHPVMS